MKKIGDCSKESRIFNLYIFFYQLLIKYIKLYIFYFKIIKNKLNNLFILIETNYQNEWWNWRHTSSNYYFKKIFDLTGKKPL